MGKQKSFIMVGLTFLGVMLFIIILGLVTKNIKKTRIEFTNTNYYLEIGSTRALAPNIYAGGELKENIVLKYTVDKQNIISFEEGTYAENGDKFVLNGIQTDIPYDANITPVRNESTKTWFINGKDTGYTYEGIQITIKALSVGEITLKATGTVNGETFELTTKITVCLPNPKSLDLNYIDDTAIVKKGSSFTVDYKVKAPNTIAQPLQSVTLTDASRSSLKNILVIENTKVTCPETGKFAVKVSVNKEAFSEIGIYEGIYKTFNIIVLDTTDEQIKAINDAREAIAALGTIENNPEDIAKVESARVLVDLIEEANLEAVTNLELLTKAEKKIENFK